MSYIIQQNKLNQGSLVGRYALKDLSNSGKYSGYINNVPVRREVIYNQEGDNWNSITLSAGSTIVVPDGTMETDSGEKKCDYVKLARDLTLKIRFSGNAEGSEKDTSRFIYVVYKIDSQGDGSLEIARGAAQYPVNLPEVIYGDSQSAVIASISRLKIQHAYYTASLQNDNETVRCSLPIGYFDSSLKWHTFNAIGFAENYLWVEEGVEALYPEGRDFTSNYKCSNVSIGWLTISKFAGSDVQKLASTTKSLMLSKSGKVYQTPMYTAVDKFEDIDQENGEDGFYYVLEDNFIYEKISTTVNKETKYVKLCDISGNNNKVVSLSNINFYKPASTLPIENKVKVLEEKINNLDTDVQNIDLSLFLNRETGGIIRGKTEYKMSGLPGTSEMVNVDYLESELNGYAKLSGDTFSGPVSIPTPAQDTVSNAVNGEWVKIYVRDNLRNTDDELNGVIKGGYDNTTIDISKFTQSNFVAMFNQMVPDFSKSPIVLSRNLWYKFNIPGWIQWNSSEADDRNGLYIGSNPSNKYMVAQVAAWASHDSCAAAGLVPIGVGQWAYCLKGKDSNKNPVARFFPFVGYKSNYAPGTKYKNTTYNVNCIEIS